MFFFKKKLPDTQKVAKRALCLYALIMRGNFEQVVQGSKSMNLSAEAEKAVISSHEELVSKFDKWLSKERLAEHQSKTEKRLFATSLGKWENQALIDASWRVQSLAVLLWALSIIDRIPSYDEEVGEKLVIDHIGIKKGAQDFMDRVSLRDKGYIEEAREVAELWHWRARTTQLIRDGSLTPEQDVGGGLSLKEVIRLAADKGHEAGALPAPIDGDFPAFGKAYKDLTDEEYVLAMSIAMERHYALNWLCGYSKDWDEVPTNT